MENTNRKVKTAGCKQRYPFASTLESRCDARARTHAVVDSLFYKLSFQKFNKLFSNSL